MLGYRIVKNEPERRSVIDIIFKVVAIIGILAAVAFVLYCVCDKFRNMVCKFCRKNCADDFYECDCDDCLDLFEDDDEIECECDCCCEDVPAESAPEVTE